MLMFSMSLDAGSIEAPSCSSSLRPLELLPKPARMRQPSKALLITSRAVVQLLNDGVVLPLPKALFAAVHNCDTVKLDPSAVNIDAGIGPFTSLVPDLAIPLEHEVA